MNASFEGASSFFQFNKNVLREHAYLGGWCVSMKQSCCFFFNLRKLFCHPFNVFEMSCFPQKRASLKCQGGHCSKYQTTVRCIPCHFFWTIFWIVWLNVAELTHQLLETIKMWDIFSSKKKQKKNCKLETKIFYFTHLGINDRNQCSINIWKSGWCYLCTNNWLG